MSSLQFVLTHGDTFITLLLSIIGVVKLSDSPRIDGGFSVGPGEEY